VSLRCWLGHHDWEHICYNDERVCLRCKRHEITISIGGGWGGWQEVSEWRAAQAARRARRERAKRIADMTSDTSSEVQGERP
jgi:hypothetical protein